MKIKNLLFTLVLILAIGATTSTQAQVFAKQYYTPSYTDGGIDYQINTQGAYRVGLHANLDGWVVSLSTGSNPLSDTVIKSSVWNLNLGYKYCHYITGPLFAEAQLDFGYHYNSQKFYTDAAHTNTDKSYDGRFGCTLSPRVGVDLFTLEYITWSLVAGYRYDMIDFKFNQRGFATIGLVLKRKIK